MPTMVSLKSSDTVGTNHNLCYKLRNKEQNLGAGSVWLSGRVFEAFVTVPSTTKLKVRLRKIESSIFSVAQATFYAQEPL